MFRMSIQNGCSEMRAASRMSQRSSKVSKPDEDGKSIRDKGDFNQDEVRLYALPSDFSLCRKVLAFRDVGGYEEAKLEIIEYVNFIHHQDRYKKLGARMPKGALLIGPPGTGKTLMARATAGEANIPFIACSSASLLLGSEGPQKLREIFKFAYEKTPCVLFFDEIDCIGRARNHELSKPETQCLTEELLVQLDGFDQVGDRLLIVLASTNDECSLDPALMRPGRFDRLIKMPHPDTSGRMSILKVHLAPLTTSIDKVMLSKRFAILTAGFSGAQIAAMCNEAAIIAARDMNEEILMEHFEMAFHRIRSGLKKRKAMKNVDKLRYARHDAAHAIAGWFLKGAAPPTKLSIMQNVDGGVECSQAKCVPTSDSNCGKDEIINVVATVLAGAAAEEMYYDHYESNCCDDFEGATKIMLGMVTNCGMSSRILGKTFVQSMFSNSYDSFKFVLSDATVGKVFEEVKSELDKSYAIAKKILVEHKDHLEKVAELLAKKELLTLDMLVNILGPSPHVDMDQLVADDEDFLPPGLESWNQ